MIEARPKPPLGRLGLPRLSSSRLLLSMRLKELRSARVQRVGPSQGGEGAAFVGSGREQAEAAPFGRCREHTAAGPAEQPAGAIGIAADAGAQQGQGATVAIAGEGFQRAARAHLTTQAADQGLSGAR